MNSEILYSLGNSNIALVGLQRGKLTIKQLRFQSRPLHDWGVIKYPMLELRCKEACDKDEASS